jgi:hypothetical protein
VWSTRLGSDPGLARFIAQVARRVEGPVGAPDLDGLGAAVVGNYLRSGAAVNRGQHAQPAGVIGYDRGDASLRTPAAKTNYRSAGRAVAAVALAAARGAGLFTIAASGSGCCAGCPTRCCASRLSTRATEWCPRSLDLHLRLVLRQLMTVTHRASARYGGTRPPNWSAWRGWPLGL